MGLTMGYLLSDIPIREVFEYYEDGYLTWKISPVSWINAGQRVGSLRTTDGYYDTQFRNERYLVHRLVYAWHHDHMPDLIDHIDQDRSNNRICNLREADKRINAINSKIRSNNKSGVKGVSFSKTRGKWEARFKINGKSVFCGYFDDFKSAVERRKEYEQKYWKGI